MGFIRRLLQGFVQAVSRLFGAGSGNCLCDTCKWDYGDACRRPERPNAITCSDYKRP